MLQFRDTHFNLINGIEDVERGGGGGGGIMVGVSSPATPVTIPPVTTIPAAVDTPTTPSATATTTKVDTYSYVQSFYADADIVNAATEISLTSIDLYFKTKPDPQKNASGKPSPGVTLSICEITNEVPDLSKVIQSSIVRKTFDEVFSFSDASAATSFGFSSPIKLSTNRSYGIVINFEDPGYELWINKQGDKLVGTNTASSGSNLAKDGKLFQYTNANTYNALSDSDLKFVINIAKFTANTITEVYTNRYYEFFTLTSQNGDFLGGEKVYRLSANSAGTVSITAGSPVITGTGTDFTTLVAGQTIVLYGNTTSTQVMTVNQVVNATYMTTSSVVPYTNASTKYITTIAGEVYYKDKVTSKLFLDKSNANSTVKFTANDTIIGSDSHANAVIQSVDNFSVDLYRVKGDILVPAGGSLTTDVEMAVFDGSNYTVSSNNALTPTINSDSPTHVTSFDTHILSRSNEVSQVGLYTDPVNPNLVSNKSLKIDVNVGVGLANTTLYISPSVNDASLDFFVSKYNINSNSHVLDANSVAIDTEVAGNGTALSRHIGTRLSFANNKFAEDIRMFMTAYRPLGTDIKVYARLHNSSDPDAFDDKAWTPLRITENANAYSSSINRNDFIEYTLGLPQYSDAAVTLPGSFTTQLSNVVITAQGVNPTSYLANNDVIRIYNPLIPEDYVMAVAASVNSTAITLGSAISNNSIVGSGFLVDRAKYKNIAFNNITNDNVARYYSSSLVEYDTFDTVQFKIVFLSNNSYIVPRVDHYQAIGVSA